MLGLMEAYHGLSYARHPVVDGVSDFVRARRIGGFLAPGVRPLREHARILELATESKLPERIDRTTFIDIAVFRELVRIGPYGCRRCFDYGRAWPI